MVSDNTIDFKHSEAISSSPEFFAHLVENREAVILLAPFAAGRYDVTVSLKTDVSFKKYWYCQIIRVFPDVQNGAWEAAGFGPSIVEAVRKAVGNSKLMIETHGS